MAIKCSKDYFMTIIKMNPYMVVTRT